MATLLWTARRVDYVSNNWSNSVVHQAQLVRYPSFLYSPKPFCCDSWFCVRNACFHYIGHHERHVFTLQLETSCHRKVPQNWPRRRSCSVCFWEVSNAKRSFLKIESKVEMLKVHNPCDRSQYTIDRIEWRFHQWSPSVSCILWRLLSAGFTYASVWSFIPTKLDLPSCSLILCHACKAYAATLIRRFCGRSDSDDAYCRKKTRKLYACKFCSVSCAFYFRLSVEEPLSMISRKCCDSDVKVKTLMEIGSCVQRSDTSTACLFWS